MENRRQLAGDEEDEGRGRHGAGADERSMNELDLMTQAISHCVAEEWNE